MNLNIAYVSIIDHNKQCRPLAKAWAYSARINNIENCFIYSLCPETFTFLNEIEGIKAKYIDSENLCGSHSRFKKIPHGKIRACLELIEEFDAVVFCDLDAFFLKNPTSLFRDLFQSHDLVFSCAVSKCVWPKYLGKSQGWAICTGCFGVKNTEEGRKYLEDMDNYRKDHSAPTPSELRDVFPGHNGSLDLQKLTNFYFFSHFSRPEGSFFSKEKRVYLLPQKVACRGFCKKKLDEIYIYHPFDKKNQFLRCFPEYSF
tara:strand:+ start:3114 stop:3887 length:774 start_codon:yes stop_codon:yes gene_type:complete